MSNGSYFSQYESPNIVIVPTESCNPTLPERRKIGNNIIVPIVNNATFEKLNLAQENRKPHDSNAYTQVGKKKISKRQSLKSWAANYLQNIGNACTNVDTNKSSTKSPSLKTWAANYLQRAELYKKPSIWNLKIPRKTTSQRCVVSEEQSKNTTIEVTPSLTCISNANNKKSNQLKIPIKNVTDLNTVNDSNTKIKHLAETMNCSPKDKPKKAKKLNDESTKTVIVDNPSDVKNNKILKTSSLKNNKIKTDNINKNKSHEQPINHCTSLKHSLHKKSETVINMKSEKDLNSKLTKKHSSLMRRQKSRNKVDKSNIKSLVIMQNRIHDNRKHKDKTRHKEKENDNLCSKGNKASLRNTKITKKYDRLSNLTTQHNSELETSSVRNNGEISNKTKTKEKFSKSKSDVISNKKTIKSPVNRKASKTKNYRKIKVVINLICNKKSNPAQSTESSSKESNGISTTCTVSNVDLDFLNDFDIDEIVQSLHTCEKQTSQNIQSDREFKDCQNKGNIDKDSVISNTQNGYNNNTDAIELIKILKGEEDDDLMRMSIENTNELQFSNIVNNLTQGTKNSDKFDYVSKNGNTLNSKNIYSDNIVDTCTNQNKNVKETQQSTSKQQLEELKQNDNLSPLRNLPIELDDCKSINTESFKENFEFVNVQKNNFRNLGNHPLDHQQSAENVYNKDQNKIKSLIIETPKKLANIDEKDNINEEKNNNYTYKPNISHIEKNYNGIGMQDEVKDEKFTEPIKEITRCHKKNDNLSNNSVNPIFFAQNSNTHVHNNDGDPTKIAFINDNTKVEGNISGGQIQEDKHESNKEEHSVQVNIKKKDLPDCNIKIMETQKKLFNSDENSRGNIKSKVDLETILKLEERLVSYSGSKYSIISIIHTGKFSKIFKCKHPNGKYYALKMSTTNMKHNWGNEKKHMLKSLISDIPKDNLFIVCLAKAFNIGENWCFLMDYYPKNLHQILSETEKPLSIKHIQDYARQLVMAVMVLRNKNMVHLDIKPKHIVINSCNNLLKLCGFDTLSYINKMRILPNVGTVNYRPPEVILGYKSSFEIDVWSTGLVLYEMAANKKLFPGSYNNDILYKQMCTLGCVPYDMIKKSRFSDVHFMGSKFMRKSGFKGQNVSFVSKFYKNNKLCNSIYEAYFQNWAHHRSTSQQNCDIGKLNMFIKLLQKMLTVQPEARLPIEFVYANPFIYDAHTNKEE